MMAEKAALENKMHVIIEKETCLKLGNMHGLGNHIYNKVYFVYDGCFLSAI